jgi:hypothetical protein
MKKIILLFAILFAAGINSSLAQGAWTQKADFKEQERYGATGFSIDTKGYIGCGYDNSFKNDFWEYDPAVNVWTQKADFGGAGRSEAVGFSIGNKGYIGLGYWWGGHYKDFWEYDPISNNGHKKLTMADRQDMLRLGSRLEKRDLLVLDVIGTTEQSQRISGNMTLLPMYGPGKPTFPELPGTELARFLSALMAILAWVELQLMFC